jgi:hypothetical protein
LAFFHASNSSPQVLRPLFVLGLDLRLKVVAVERKEGMHLGNCVVALFFSLALSLLPGMVCLVQVLTALPVYSVAYPVKFRFVFFVVVGNVV